MKSNTFARSSQRASRQLERSVVAVSKELYAAAERHKFTFIFCVTAPYQATPSADVLPRILACIGAGEENPMRAAVRQLLHDDVGLQEIFREELLRAEALRL